MASRFYLDASALVKRYVVEMGTSVINHLFDRVARRQMLCLTLGPLEVFSVLVRKKNAAILLPAVFNQVMTDFRNEVIDASEFTKLSAPDSLVYAAMALIERYYSMPQMLSSCALL